MALKEIVTVVRYKRLLNEQVTNLVIGDLLQVKVCAVYHGHPRVAVVIAVSRTPRMGDLDEWIHTLLTALSSKCY